MVAAIGNGGDGWHWLGVMDGHVVEEEGCVYLIMESHVANGATWCINLHKHNHMFGDQRPAATGYNSLLISF